MNILDIIEKKKNKEKLSKMEIEYFVNNYVKDFIPDYQISALIMAIYLNGMTKEETANLTMAMANSGDKVDLSTIDGVIVDKHSTGGVGDKVSLILLPLIASLDIPVAKMSGRGLGFTGGTIDKLESIPGFNTDVNMRDFIENIKKIGISMISQTANLVPADKKLYSLRDAISCVESIPLISSSIMSKKIASGADKIVIDVTVGSGAFMKNISDAEKLAKEMIDIGKSANKETVCILTNMDEPLGYAVGNTLEVIEAIEFLKGSMPEDLKKVVLELGAYIMKLAQKGDNIEENKEKLLQNINNKKAYYKFVEMVKNQGGDITYIEDTSKFSKAKYIEPVYSTEDGYVQNINAKEIGKISCYLGAGRLKKEDKIDNEVGVILNKKVSMKVEKGEKIATVCANSKEKCEEAKQKILETITINDNKVEKNKMILKILQ